MKFSNFDLGWLVGIIEGEGCIFTITGTKGTPGIVVHMTDKDIITRISSLLDKPFYKKKRTNSSHKSVYSVGIYAFEAVELLTLIIPFLGLRRKTKAKEVLSKWSRRQKELIEEIKQRKLRNDRIIALYKTGKYTKLELSKKFKLKNIRPILYQYGTK